MITFKLIRKIGKILRGGAGKKEIYLGALTGVILGFNPILGLSLAVTLLATLLLNANIGFTVIGFTLGKLLSLAIAALSFHTGFFLIHSIGLEGFFSYLINLPVFARMDLEVYAMIGSFPYAIITGLILGKIMSALVTKARENMLKLSEKDKISKVTGNKLSRLLIWLVFGKQKISTQDVLNKESKTFRKSGILLVLIFIVISLLFEFLLLDRMIKQGIKSSISSKTNTEVNIEDASLSFASGKLQITKLEITDPEKPSHNLLQIESLESDLSVTDLLRKRYVIDLLSGNNLQLDTPRSYPGAIYPKEEKDNSNEEKEEKTIREEDYEFPIEKYFNLAQKYQPYVKYLYKYLLAGEKKESETSHIKSFKEQAKQSIEEHGYYKARVKLLKDTPALVVKEIEINNVVLNHHLKEQKLIGGEISTNPWLNAQESKFQLYSKDSSEANAEIIMHFEDSNLAHELKLNYRSIPITGESVSNDSPIELKSAEADIVMKGHFSTESILIPADIKLHKVDAKLKKGERILGLKPRDFNKIIKSMDPVIISAELKGTIKKPRIKIDHKKLTESFKTQMLSAGKTELYDKADDEIDRAARKLGIDEVDGLKQLFKTKSNTTDDKPEENTQSLEDSATDLINSFFK